MIHPTVNPLRRSRKVTEAFLPVCRLGAAVNRVDFAGDHAQISPFGASSRRTGAWSGWSQRTGHM
jgi:hypothetical protein